MFEGFEFTIFIPFICIYFWLFLGFVSTALLWYDAELFSKKQVTYDPVYLSAITLLCILFSPLPIYIVWKDKVLHKILNRRGIGRG